MKNPNVSLSNVQILRYDQQPMFVVVPFDQYVTLVNQTRGEFALPAPVILLQSEKKLSLIGAWRTYKEISQQQLADEIGVSQPAVAQIEREGSSPHQSTLLKVAKALGIAVELLRG